MQFKPTILIIMLTVFFSSLFIALGNWQLDRADEKQAMLDQRERVRKAEPVALPTQIEVTENADAWRYRPARETIEWLPDKQFLLDNKVHAKKAGYHVLTPARITGRDELVLVNRGWVQQGKTREALPDVLGSAMPDGQTTVQGDVYPPLSDACRAGNDMSGGQAGWLQTIRQLFGSRRPVPSAMADVWPRVIQCIDFAAVVRLLGKPVLPLVLRLSPTEPNGFARQWPTVPFSPEKHVAYAWQWFALAGVILILFISLNLKRRRSEN